MKADGTYYFISFLNYDPYYIYIGWFKCGVLMKLLCIKYEFLYEKNH